MFNIIEFTPLSYGNYLLPNWAQILGWLMAVVSVAMIPVFAVVKIGLTYCMPTDEYTGSLLNVSVNTFLLTVKTFLTNVKHILYFSNKLIVNYYYRKLLDNLFHTIYRESDSCVNLPVNGCLP